jgi:ATP-dependent helicase YprA (DUF1998 family)
MVRVGKLRDEVTQSLQGHIRRIYPIIQGPKIWGNLVEQRNKYFNNKDRFPLVQEPLIEAIPQYEEGNGSKPENMSNWKYLDGETFSKEDKERMEKLGSTLKSSGVDFNLYPHQKESIIAHLEGRDVVVATGTGSGKTESFLFPAVNHLIEEAIRCDGEDSPRAVKVMVLYPMNALVADQMTRMREIFGNPRVSSRIMSEGFGRFPQFGMYTGRTKFHGWYSSPSWEEDNQGNEIEIWDNEKAIKKMNNFVKPFLEAKKDPNLWNQLRKKGKIPSIGGAVEFAGSDVDPKETIPFKYLPLYTQKFLCKKENRNGRSKDEVRNSRFIISENEKVFERFKMGDRHTKKVPEHLKYLGDGLDRELVSRHQMHLGGVRQYLENRYPKVNPNEFIHQLKVGIPDIMVTNYSMLEYMLMRPMEHIFWYKTSEWLKNSPSSRLLLVVDEAHMYEGAMGTEFSLLLNRMLSVLFPDTEDMEKARERIQFIITSASLGSEESASRDYASGLLSLSKDRKEKMWLPKTKLKQFDHYNGEDTKIDKEVMDKLYDYSKRILSGADRVEFENRLFTEILGEEKFDNILQISESITSGQELGVVRRDRLARFIEYWPAAHRLRRLLTQRKSFSVIQSNQINQSYMSEEISQPEDVEDRLPLRYGIVKNYMFEESESENSVQAMDFLLDIIASAHKFDERRPFLPIRMHLFTRGDTRSRICPRCGSISSDGTERCLMDNCDSLVYELMLDRNCGGSFLLLWWSSEGIKRLNNHERTPDINSFDTPAQAWQIRNKDPNLSRNADNYVGVLSQVLDKETYDNSSPPPNSADKLLNTINGSVKEVDDDNFEQDHYVLIRIFSRGGQMKKSWEKKEGWIDPRVCIYCTRNYAAKKTAQFSNTETRGDQFFNELVSNCTGQLDGDPSSPHAHQGRKMLIFSDGRQRAARLARDLKSAQAKDQGRAMFIHLSNISWYRDLPDKFRVLSELYPYLCLMSANSRTNPLSDSSSAPNRSRMLSHTNLLMIYLDNIYSSETPKLENIPNSVWPDFDKKVQFESFCKKRLKESLKRDINKWTNDDLTHHRMTEEWAKKVNKLKIEIRKTRNHFNKNVANSSFWSELIDDEHIDFRCSNIFQKIFDIDIYNDMKDSESDLPPLKYNHFLSTHKKLRQFSSNLENLIPFFRHEWIIGNPSINQTNLLQEISSNLLKSLEKGEINNEDFALKCQEWNQTYFRLHLYPIPPKQLGDLLLQWIADDLFGIMSLGLGSLRISDDFAPDLNLQEKLGWHITKYALPLIFLDHRKQTKTVGRKTFDSSRAISSNTETSIPKRKTSFPHHDSKYNSQEGKFKNSGINFEDFKTQLPHSLGISICGKDPDNKQIPNPNHPGFNDYLKYYDEFIKWLTNENYQDQSKSILFERGNNRKQVFISSDSLIFEPLDLDFDYSNPSKGVFCSTCLNRRPESHVEVGINCVECSGQSTETIDLTSASTPQLQRERAESYLRERLRPWYKLVTGMGENGKTLAVYRAEEHTAQISEMANDGDGYTRTELYELMFMDIPIQTEITEIGDKYESPPIDILSCTTTMEVGIDLGDLNAVALRTVPPHASNYQQRVGRAGRGSSEVSVALTWVDNSSYAQEFFIKPEKLVTNPKNPPLLYLENRKIRQRHMNAILFQRYFKQPDYSPDTLTFDGMSPGVGQLLESLGTVGGFIHKTGNYGLNGFIEYLNEIDDGTNSSERKIIKNVCNITDENELNNWIKILRDKVKQWPKHFTNEEEE